MIAYRAPGKAVIWGEYAVLAGAPAMVMAVDRYAVCRFSPGGERFHIVGRGFEGEATLSADELAAERSDGLGVAAPVAAALHTLGIADPGSGAEIELDTRSFHAAGGRGKLGIGSSAAICTAACAAAAAAFGLTLSFPQALAAHRWMQNPRGSGIDVAASYYGGTLRFEDGAATPAPWPGTLRHSFLWTGSSASTRSHLERFARYRAQKRVDALDRLAALCRELFETPCLDGLRAYMETLKQLDHDAQLGIYSMPHERLHALAIEMQVVYKPCGAGGGDIGVAFAESTAKDNEKLSEFTRAAAELAYHPLSLEIAPHGIEPTR